MIRPVATSTKPTAETTWDDFKKWWIGQGSSDSHHVVRFYDEHPLMSPALHITKSSICVIDIKSMKYTYLSPNFGEFVGRVREEYENGGVQFTFSIIHPDDIPGVMSFSELINEYFKNLPDSQKSQYRTFWDFRLKDHAGKYFKIIQQDCTLKYSGDGKIEELMVISSNIESAISSDSQRLRMTNGVENVCYRYDHHTKETIRLEDLSKREMEIAKMIARSKSLKEIGVELGISFNTVKVHSANMMEKLKVNDSLEMVNILRTWGFI